MMRPWPVPEDAYQGKVVLFTQCETALDRALIAGFEATGARTVVLRAWPGQVRGDGEVFLAPGADPGAVSAAFDEIERRLGAPVDIFVANRRIMERNPAEQVSLQSWRTAFDHILDTTFVTVTEFGRRRIAANASGSVLLVTDRYARYGGPGAVATAAVDGALENLMKTLAVEWGYDDLRINALQLGLIAGREDPAFDLARERQMAPEASVPLGRLGEPNDVVSAALYLCSDYAIYVQGSTFVIDGGEQIRVRIGGPVFTPRRDHLAAPVG